MMKAVCSGASSVQALTGAGSDVHALGVSGSVSLPVSCLISVPAYSELHSASLPPAHTLSPVFPVPCRRFPSLLSGFSLLPVASRCFPLLPVASRVCNR